MSLFWTQFLCSYVCPLTCGAKPRLVPHISGPSAATSTDVTAEDPVRFFLHLLMQPHQTSFFKYISTQHASTTHLNISCNPYPSTKHTLRCSQGGNSFTYLTERTLPKKSLSHVIILCYQNT